MCCIAEGRLKQWLACKSRFDYRLSEVLLSSSEEVIRPKDKDHISDKTNSRSLVASPPGCCRSLEEVGVSTLTHTLATSWRVKVDMRHSTVVIGSTRWISQLEFFPGFRLWDTDVFLQLLSVLCERYGWLTRSSATKSRLKQVCCGTIAHL